MTWKQLLEDGRVERHRTTREELNALRAVAERNLRDAGVEAISIDTRFGCAYEAALTLATMAIARAGYRVKGPGHHRVTFEALLLALPGAETTVDARYFDRCRRLRNVLSYESAGVVTRRDLDELSRTVVRFRTRVEKAFRA